jgi:tetratricopeptide (TPR) repeat protein
MYLFNKSTGKYDIIHDNLNDIWLIADLSNKKYKFYYRYKHTNNNLNIPQNRFKLSFSNIFNLIISTTLLFLLFISLNVNNQCINNDRIYKEFYTKYPSLSISRSEVKNKNLINETLLSINNNDYTSALKNIQIIINSGKNDNVIIAHFYKGVILQEKGKYKEAIKEYEQVIKNEDNLFIEQAHWYIGLCYLKDHNKNKAIEYFNKLSNSTYKNKSQEILSKIN